MNTGWVRIYRQIEEDSFWLKEPFTRGQAWLDLIIFANHKDNSFYTQGVEIQVKRGQIAWSEVTMSKRWKWSRGKVRRFLEKLRKDEKIVQQVVQQKTTILTLVNYDKWQQDEQKMEQLTVQLTDSRRYTNKNDKNEKNIYTSNEKIIFSYFISLKESNPKIVDLASKYDIRPKDVVWCIRDMLSKSSDKGVEIKNVLAKTNTWINNSLRWHKITTLSGKEEKISNKRIKKDDEIPEGFELVVT